MASVFLICMSWQLTFLNGHTLNRRHAYLSFHDQQKMQKNETWKHTLRNFYDQHVLVEIKLEVAVFDMFFKLFPRSLFSKHVCSQLQKTNATVFPKCKCWKRLKTNNTMKTNATAVQVFSNCFPKVFSKTCSFITQFESRKFRTTVFFSHLFFARCCLQIILITGYTTNNSKWNSG